jgi:hypothetical protein
MPADDELTCRSSTWWPTFDDGVPTIQIDLDEGGTWTFAADLLDKVRTKTARSESKPMEFRVDLDARPVRPPTRLRVLGRGPIRRPERSPARRRERRAARRSAVRCSTSGSRDGPLPSADDDPPSDRLARWPRRVAA